GESEHRRIKSFYSRTQKGNHVRGIAKHVDRERTLHQTREALKRRPHSKEPTPEPEPEEKEKIGPTLPEVHYHISQDVKNKIDILKWLSDNRGDAALSNFLPKLKDHLLTRFLGPRDSTNPYTKQDHLQVNIVNNRLYRHKVLRVNYTTYDMRRCQDVINPRTHGDIMVLAKDFDKGATEPTHPYWYARVIGIFHATVGIKKPNTPGTYEVSKVDFLFVRWFGLDVSAKAGWKAKRLYQVGFLDGNDPEAFGFVDPEEVIRAIHLIPRFSLGRTNHLLGRSIARSFTEQNEDWDRYYVGK
ncbi:hypothetical protein CPC08DRAFT_646789, partial [Agrocybe pediades]